MHTQAVHAAATFSTERELVRSVIVSTAGLIFSFERQRLGALIGTYTIVPRDQVARVAENLQYEVLDWNELPQNTAQLQLHSSVQRKPSPTA